MPSERGDSPVAIYTVRLIIGISLLLLGVGMVCCQVEGFSAPSPTSGSPTPWVRTVDGWERHDSWKVSAIGPPPIHPLVVAAGQTLASVLALAVFQRDPQPTGREC